MPPGVLALRPGHRRVPLGSSKSADPRRRQIWAPKRLVIVSQRKPRRPRHFRSALRVRAPTICRRTHQLRFPRSRASAAGRLHERVRRRRARSAVPRVVRRRVAAPAAVKLQDLGVLTARGRSPPPTVRLSAPLLHRVELEGTPSWTTTRFSTAIKVHEATGVALVLPRPRHDAKRHRGGRANRCAPPTASSLELRLARAHNDV